MAIKQKAAGLRTQAASKDKCCRSHSRFRTRIQPLVVDFVRWGLPLSLAECIIRRGGLGDA